MGEGKREGFQESDRLSYRAVVQNPDSALSTVTADNFELIVRHLRSNQSIILTAGSSEKTQYVLAFWCEIDNLLKFI